MDKKKAIEIVMGYEKKQGRNPEKMNKFKTGYDLKSGERFIDVKLNGKRNQDLLISFSNFKRLGENISKYYVYLLVDEKEPKLKIIEPDFILKNMSLLTLINLKSNLLKNLDTIRIDENKDQIREN